jgi:hypothetical protein
MPIRGIGGLLSASESRLVAHSLPEMAAKLAVAVSTGKCTAEQAAAAMSSLADEEAADFAWSAFDPQNQGVLPPGWTAVEVPASSLASLLDPPTTSAGPVGIIETIVADVGGIIGDVAGLLGIH